MTKYRLMFLLSKRENLEDLYKFDVIDIDGEIKYREFETLEEVDTYVEDLLNKGEYSREEISVVQVKEYDIFTNISNTISTVSDKIIPKTTIYYDENTDSFYSHIYETE